jgi:hypothetical protein
MEKAKGKAKSSKNVVDVFNPLYSNMKKEALEVV